MIIQMLKVSWKKFFKYKAMHKKKFLIVAFIIGISIVLNLAPNILDSADNHIELTILYNNVPSDPRLVTDWGFACFIHQKSKNILFDTGGSGRVLLSNMNKLRINLEDVDVIVLSHIHMDHTGGLKEFLKRNSHVTVYFPHSFPQTFRDDILKMGCNLIAVDQPIKICEGVYSSGEMGVGIREQALILKTSKGLIVITGCAHPGIVDIVKHAKDWLKEEIYLVLGGFHLMRYSESEVGRVITRLQEMSVKKVAPSHCTGETAIRQFKAAWGDNFLNGGCGAVINIP